MYKKFWVLPHFDNFFYFARNILPNNVDPDFPQAKINQKSGKQFFRSHAFLLIPNY